MLIAKALMRGSVDDVLEKPGRDGYDGRRAVPRRLIAQRAVAQITWSHFRPRRNRCQLRS
jgi:hypothetical protein